MDKNRPTKGPSDALRIDLRKSPDVHYWCAKLRCTESQLREAVGQVGPMPSNIEAYLRQRENARGLDNAQPPGGRRLS
ncbi:MAG: DUF3606 domain-containing protein [Betaproteobacteria bacterium]